MTRSLIPWIILILSLLFDYYGFQAVKSAFQSSSDKARSIAYMSYWSLSIILIGYFVLGLLFNFREHSTPFTRYMAGVFMGIFISKLILISFLLIEDISRVLLVIYNYVFHPKEPLNTSRRQFLDAVFLGVGSLPFFAFMYGMFKTAYDYQIRKVSIPIDDLPENLNELKIVQISDIHSGSFNEIDPLKKAIDIINKLEPDIFVFTGDLVNNKAEEYTPLIDIFKNIRAKYGQFSILGNHDYGDYVEWASEQLKIQNLETLKSYHRDSNWDLLCNEHRILDIRGEKIALIGVENWGAHMRFAKYGNMTKAYSGAETISTKILLSHDPSHWDAEVRKKYKDISLTLSGHTHGMQFGIDNKWLKFSPVQWFYKQWAGLYSEDNQHIYVNRGFGFIGYPGRVGIRPEITVLTLQKA